MKKVWLVIGLFSVLFLSAVGYWLYTYFTVYKSSRQFQLGNRVDSSATLFVYYQAKRVKNKLVYFFERAQITHPVEVYFSQLDGGGVTDRQKQIPRIIGIMIDNHPDTRPQSGLSQARIVYESLVEGGLTRYLAIFDQEQVIARVGPVRSARPYYIDWIREYGNSLYMFCGGSPQALDEADDVGIMAADEFYWNDYYWRNNLLVSPHNLFTSSSLWQKLYSNFAISSSTIWQGWKFGVNATSSESISSIILPFSDFYEVVWRYDRASDTYERYLDGVKQVDREGNTITADNIIVQFTATQILDEVGRLRIDTSGGGEARVLRNGGLIRGTWKKDSIDNRTRFYDKDGREIVLTPGKTWVEVLPNNAMVKVEN